MNNSATHILKFGGTSLQNSDFIKQSVRIVTDRLQDARPFVVVSALQGVTDALISITENTGPINGEPQRLSRKHLDIFDRLIEDDKANRKNLLQLFNELDQKISELQTHPQNRQVLKDHILSIGERASAIIFASLLSAEGFPAAAFNASRFIKTDSAFGKANVDFNLTQNLIRQTFQASDLIPVVTGFIGSDNENRITTLGRSGSDYTAGLLADALDADHLEIWTDVNGVLSADPRWVPAAQSIPELSFGDISELSAHGAQVIHPQTVRPISNRKTSILVKNSYNPAHPGTAITSGLPSNGELKTITVTGPFVQLQIDHKYSSELYQSVNSWLEEKPGAETFEFDQSSQFEPARFLFPKEVFNNISDKLATWSVNRNTLFDLRNKLYKVKKFSNHFSDDEMLTHRIWKLFASNGLQPLNSSRHREERFISFLFEEKEARLAARLMNSYLQDNKPTIDLFVAGTGAVGQTLLDQLKTQKPSHFNLRLIGACNSRYSLWDESGLDLKRNLDWSDKLATDWDILLEKLTAPHRHNLIFVDATGSKEIARLYPRLLKHGVHIVTPSKLANTFEQSFFDKLQKLTERNGSSFHYETTVGAGLPVVSTIKNLKASGDSITEISGVVSGTMTYLFNQLENGVPFSKAIARARELGYAEPDPRDDLSGEDAARKFLTLARILGWKIERDELEVESLIPEELKDVDRETFLANLSRYDSRWQKRINIARKHDETLRYTGQLKDGKVAIGIESVPISSPVGQLSGTDNLIQIVSEFYSQAPLIIQGPGAGKEVTAAGVVSDILQTAKELVKT